MVVVSVTEMVMVTVEMVVVMETGYGITVVVLITKMVMVTVDMVVVMVRLVIQGVSKKRLNSPLAEELL